MDVFDFISKDSFASIQQHIKRREVFSYTKSAKSAGNTVTIRFESRFIAKDLAKEIWSGNDYLVHWNVDYRGKIGQGGSGRAYADLEQFCEWETFKDWFDRQLERFEGYESEKFGQLCLFE